MQRIKVVTILTILWFGSLGWVGCGPEQIYDLGSNRSAPVQGAKDSAAPDGAVGIPDVTVMADPVVVPVDNPVVVPVLPPVTTPPLVVPVAPPVIAPPLVVPVPPSVIAPPLVVPVGGVWEGGGDDGGGRRHDHDDEDDDEDCEKECIHSEDCHSKNPCVQFRCERGTCVKIPIPGCVFCKFNSDCHAPNEICEDHQCVCPNIVCNGLCCPAGISCVDNQCASGPQLFTVGGSITGLTSAGLVLQNNGGDNISPPSNATSFTFPTSLPNAASYNVTVLTQPAGLTCTVAPPTGSGTINNANVTSVQVVCSAVPGFTVGGTIQGLTADGLVLRNNAGASGVTTIEPAAGATNFAFGPYPNGTTYDVTVQTQPTGLTCSVTPGTGSGTIAGSNITNVQVICSPAPSGFTVGGTIQGLTADGLILQNNAVPGGVTTLGPIASGATQFVFSPQYPNGTTYNVTVQTQPAGLFCSVTPGSGSGTIAGSNINNVQVVCVAAFTVGGTIQGLTANGLVLRNNAVPGGLTSTAPASGATQFVFSPQYPNGTTYNVTVQTQPTGLFCSVTPGTGSGTINNANVMNVQVVCVPAFTVGGTIQGLTANGLVLQNNAVPGGPTSIGPASGATQFVFGPQYPNGTTYNVTVQTQPAGLFCSVTPGTGSGTINNANVTNVQVVCVPGFTVGGTIQGLTANGLVLRNNAVPGGLTFIGAASGATQFVFSPTYPNGATYNVTVQTQPAGLFCSVTPGTGSGTINNANVTNVQVVCEPGFTVGGTIQGLTASGLVLRNNAVPGGMTVTVPASGATQFVFSSQYLNGATYNVTVQTQPTGLFCSVTPGTGSGTINNANVMNVEVVCEPGFSVGGTIQGLTANGLILQNNAVPGGTTDLGPQAGATNFAFGPYPDGTTYDVTVLFQPMGLVCSVTPGTGSGTIAGANITNVEITCSPALFSVGGAFFGVPVEGLVLRNTAVPGGTTDLAPAEGASQFVFDPQYPSGTTYNVTVQTQPANAICSVVAPTGSGTINNANVTSVQVFCMLTAPSPGGILEESTADATVLKNAADLGKDVCQ